MTWTHWVSNQTNAPSCRRPLSRFGSSSSKVKDHQLATENVITFIESINCVSFTLCHCDRVTHLIVTQSTIIRLFNEHVIGHRKCDVLIFINFVAKQFQWQHFIDFDMFTCLCVTLYCSTLHCFAYILRFEYDFLFTLYSCW